MWLLCWEHAGNIYMTTCLRACMLWTKQTPGMNSISTWLHAYVPACSEHCSHRECNKYLHDDMPTCLHALYTAATINVFNIYMSTCLRACMLSTQQPQSRDSISTWLRAYMPAQEIDSISTWLYVSTCLHDMNTGNGFNIYMTTCLRACTLWTQKSHGMDSISTWLRAHVPECFEHSSHRE